MNESLHRLVRRGESVLLITPVAAVIAALSLALAAAGPAWVAVVAWLSSAAIIAEETVRSRRSGFPGYGREVPARLLLFCASAFGAVAHSPAQSGWIWTITAVLLIGVTAEPLLLRALLPLRDVHALPGYRLPPGAAAVPLFVWATAVELPVAGALAVVDAPLTIRLALLVVAVVLGVAMVGIGLVAWCDRTPSRWRLRQALEAYAPQFILYTGRDDGGAYQLAMWLPYLERLGVPFIVVVRRHSALEAVTSVTGAPIVSRASMRDLDDVMVGSIRAAFYPSSAANNGHAVAYRHVRHVYLGHGDSDKALSPHPMHAMYDEIFVAGKAAIDRYRRNAVHIPAAKFVVIGRPQLDSIHAASGRVPQRPTVLYAPTWSGHNAAGTNSSLSEGLALVGDLLAEDVTVIFRPHPISRRLRAERAQAAAIDALLRHDAVRTGRIHRHGPAVDSTSFADSANACDVMIADMSSIMVDFLGSDKPMAVNVRGTESAQGFLERYPVARGAYLVEPDRGNLASVLTAMLGSDPLRTQRHETRMYYLGGLDGPGAVDAFLSAARECVRPEHGGGEDRGLRP